MKILVTGAAGFIGSHTTDELISKGYEVIVIDNLSTGLKENLNPRAVFYQEDLSNYDKIKEIFEKEKPEVIFHLAAQIDVRKSVENPVEDARINIVNALNLLELAIKYKIKHFIFSSTGGAIYGDTKTPTFENEKENPVSPYGCAKLAIEKYLNFYNKVHNLKYTCLRYANVYRERQNGKGEAGVIAIFFEKMFSGENPAIFGGLQTRDFVYVKDVVNANLLALNDDKSEVYNVGTGKETNIIEIFSKINNFFGNKFQVIYKEKKKGEQEKSCLSFEKINKSLGWKPKFDLDKGLEQVYDWYKRKSL